MVTCWLDRCGRIQAWPLLRHRKERSSVAHDGCPQSLEVLQAKSDGQIELVGGRPAHGRGLGLSGL